MNKILWFILVLYLFVFLFFDSLFERQYNFNIERFYDPSKVTRMTPTTIGGDIFLDNKEWNDSDGSSCAIDSYGKDIYPGWCDLYENDKKKACNACGGGKQQQKPKVTTKPASVRQQTLQAQAQSAEEGSPTTMSPTTMSPTTISTTTTPITSLNNNINIHDLVTNYDNWYNNYKKNNDNWYDYLFNNIIIHLQDPTIKIIIDDYFKLFLKIENENTNIPQSTKQNNSSNNIYNEYLYKINKIQSVTKYKLDFNNNYTITSLIDDVKYIIIVEKIYLIYYVIICQIRVHVI